MLFSGTTFIRGHHFLLSLAHLKRFVFVFCITVSLRQAMKWLNWWHELNTDCSWYCAPLNPTRKWPLAAIASPLTASVRAGLSKHYIISFEFLISSFLIMSVYIWQHVSVMECVCLCHYFCDGWCPRWKPCCCCVCCCPWNIWAHCVSPWGFCHAWPHTPPTTRWMWATWPLC